MKYNQYNQNYTVLVAFCMALGTAHCPAKPPRIPIMSNFATLDFVTQAMFGATALCGALSTYYWRQVTHAKEGLGQETIAICEETDMTNSSEYHKKRQKLRVFSALTITMLLLSSLKYALSTTATHGTQ